MFAATFIAEVLFAGIAAWLLAARRPQWSHGRVVLVSALPIPLIIWGFCVYIIVDASMASAKECGVDACGMAIAAAMFVAMATFGLFLLGALVAHVVARSVPRPVEPNLAEIFE